jgi:hypothetical protein
MPDIGIPFASQDCMVGPLLPRRISPLVKAVRTPHLHERNLGRESVCERVIPTPEVGYIHAGAGCFPLDSRNAHPPPKDVEQNGAAMAA